MKHTFYAQVVFVFLSILFNPIVEADQLENETVSVSAPEAVLVKANPETKTVEVFRVNTLDKRIVNRTASMEEEVAIIEQIERSGNKIGEFSVGKELDKDTSTEACYGRWYAYGWSWSSWGGYRPFAYNWYRPFVNPGYFRYGAGGGYYGGGNPGPGYGNPNPGYGGGNPNPGYGNPNPGYGGGNPNPGYGGGNPNPGYGGGYTPGYNGGNPNPGYGGENPGYGGENPGNGGENPGYGGNEYNNGGNGYNGNGYGNYTFRRNTPVKNSNYGWYY